MTSRRLRQARRLCGSAIAMVIVSLSLGFSGGTANADTWPTDWGAGWGVFNPDHGAHNYCFHATDTPGAALRSRMAASMTYMASSTDASTFEVATCDTTSAGGQTDVVWRGARVEVDGDEVIGLTRCMRRFNNGLCDRYRVTVNGPFIRDHYAAADNRERQYRKTACHELGHTLGLNHFPAPHESCQRSGWTGTVTDSWIRTWTAHHRGHIDDWF